MVTGGFAKSYKEGLASVELLNMDGSWHCSLPSLPSARRSHTQTGLVECGGFNLGDNTTQNTCVTFNDDEDDEDYGYWVKTHNLEMKRTDHSSWASPQGVILIGGNTARTTTELLTNNGKTKPSFELKAKRGHRKVRLTL